MVTEGVIVAALGLPVARFTVKSLVGAGETVMVPKAVPPDRTLFEASETVIVGSTTIVTVADAEVSPLATFSHVKVSVPVKPTLGV